MMKRNTLAIASLVVVASCSQHRSEAPTPTPTTEIKVETEAAAVEAVHAPSSEAPTAASPVGESTPPSKAAPCDKAVYQLYDNGVRCIAAPCPSWTAIAADGSKREITDIDLDALKLSPDDKRKLLAAMHPGRKKLCGEIKEGAKQRHGLEVFFHATAIVGDAEPPPNTPKHLPDTQ